MTALGLSRMEPRWRWLKRRRCHRSSSKRNDLRVTGQGRYQGGRRRRRFSPRHPTQVTCAQRAGPHRPARSVVSVRSPTASPAVKTAEIARLSGTTESTLFRHFTGMDEIIDSAIEWAWDTVNTAIANYDFDHPRLDDEVGPLERDCRAVLSMFDDPILRLAEPELFLAIEDRAGSPSGRIELPAPLSTQTRQSVLDVQTGKS